MSRSIQRSKTVTMKRSREEIPASQQNNRPKPFPESGENENEQQRRSRPMPADDAQPLYCDMVQQKIRISGHVAVCLEHYILVVGGAFHNGDHSSHRVIWMFNLYTEKWRKHVIHDSGLIPPGSTDACAAAIGRDAYFFGGMIGNDWSKPINELWKLTRTSKGHFAWRQIKTSNNQKVPSPRFSHTGWGFERMLWVFGGTGEPPVGYLNDYGDFDEISMNHGINNQLLCFDPSVEEWTNLRCSGSVPTPRAYLASTVIQNKAWLYGGVETTGNIFFDELFDLNLDSLVWTQVQTGQVKPPGCLWGTLTTISDSKLVLHGGFKINHVVQDTTWILDLPSQKWKQYTSDKDHHRFNHSGSSGLNSSIITIGGKRCFCSVNSYDAYETTFHVMLEPRSLQQLAMQMISENRRFIAWKLLPPKLIAKLF